MGEGEENEGGDKHYYRQTNAGDLAEEKADDEEREECFHGGRVNLAQ